MIKFNYFCDIFQVSRCSLIGGVRFGLNFRSDISNKTKYKLKRSESSFEIGFELYVPQHTHIHNWSLQHFSQN